MIAGGYLDAASQEALESDVYLWLEVKATTVDGVHLFCDKTPLGLDAAETLWDLVIPDIKTFCGRVGRRLTPLPKGIGEDESMLVIVYATGYVGRIIADKSEPLARLIQPEILRLGRKVAPKIGAHFPWVQILCRHFPPYLVMMMLQRGEYDTGRVFGTARKETFC